MNNRFVAIATTEGRITAITIHLPDTTGNHATLCGMDGNDPHPSVNQSSATAPARAKVNCPQCYALWKVAQQYTKADFIWTEGRL